MAKAVYRFSVRGAGALAAEFDRKQRATQDELIEYLRRLGRLGVAILIEHAPEDTGQLKANVRAVPYFRARFPRVSIGIDRLLGHGGDERDYLDVTRFGHRQRHITPKRASRLTVHTMGHRAGDFVYRRSVRGYQPDSDWVADADPELRALGDEEAARLGRRIEARVVR